MNPSFLGMLLLFSSIASAQVRLEYDGKQWNPNPSEPKIEQQILSQGAVITAESKRPIGEFLQHLNFEKLQGQAIRFTAKDAEGKDVTIDAIPNEPAPQSSLIAICDSKMVNLAHLNTADKFPKNTACLNADLKDSDAFLKAIKDSIQESKTSDQTLRAALIIHSECTYGWMIEVLQLMREGGCTAIVIRMNDEIASANKIEVLPDPLVTPPVVKAEKPDTRHRRIVIEMHEGGTITGADSIPLANDEAILTHITKHKDETLKAGLEPILFLKGEKETLFKSSRRVIRLAAETGVTKVIFGAYSRDNPSPGEADQPADNQPANAAKTPLQKWLPAPREQNLNLAPPSSDSPPSKNVAAYIHLDAEGRVFIGKDRKPVGADPKQRQLPLLEAALQELKQASGQTPLQVTIHPDPNASQQRVIDVLNTLAKVNITAVTFSDKHEP